MRNGSAICARFLSQESKKQRLRRKFLCSLCCPPKKKIHRSEKIRHLPGAIPTSIVLSSTVISTCSFVSWKSVRRIRTRSSNLNPEITGPGCLGTAKMIGRPLDRKSPYCWASAYTRWTSRISFAASSLRHQRKNVSVPLSNMCHSNS